MKELKFKVEYYHNGKKYISKPFTLEDIEIHKSGDRFITDRYYRNAYIADNKILQFMGKTNRNGEEIYK